MDPKDTPVKFPLHTRVRIIKGANTGHTGRIVMERHDGKNNQVSFDDGGHDYFSDYALEAIPEPEVGDLVKVKAYGKWQGHEGHIISDNAATFSVDFGYDEKAAFGATALEVIEKVKPLPEKPVRIEGKPIKPKDVKRGDKISVVSVEDNEIKRTTILEATVDKIITKGFYGQHREFQTRTGKKIFNNEYLNESVISLVADIDKDVDFSALSEIKPNEIIAFPDVDGGPEVNIAVKKEYADQWHLLLGEKSAKSGTTVGLVTLLKKKGVTFSVIRKMPNPLEFPVGTHVRVSQDYTINLWQGHYKVVIEHPSHSVIKSRGISATTYTVPNEYLRKD